MVIDILGPWGKISQKRSSIQDTGRFSLGIYSITNNHHMQSPGCSFMHHPTQLSGQHLPIPAPQSPPVSKASSQISPVAHSYPRPRLLQAPHHLIHAPNARQFPRTHASSAEQRMLRQFLPRDDFDHLEDHVVVLYCGRI